MGTRVLLPSAFSVAQSDDTAPAALSCPPRRRHNLEIPISPLSPCGTVCFGCPARRLDLFLPIILILSWGVIGIELSVWKSLLRTQRIKESSEAELWKDSCPRPLGREGSGFSEQWFGQQVGVALGMIFSAFSVAMGHGECCHFQPSLHYLVKMQVNCPVV